jgi:puromycin-sensitive aminopeptidase
MSTAVVDRDTSAYKLPTNVRPSRYEIKLTPDLQNFTFVGEESIDIAVREATNEILLNAVELEVQSAVAKKDGTSTEYDAQVTMEEANERVVLRFSHNLEPGKWTLQLNFTGILNDKLNGFYRSSYKDSQGDTKIIATTQFEATDARKAFPCWDEPEHKAVFGITLVVDNNLTAISNAGIKSEEPVAGTSKKAVNFLDTMKMSTYLVAFIVGEFESTDPVNVGPTPIRIWSVPGKRYLGKFAQDIAVSSLSFFQDYYGIPYPGDKLDLIAIPDFASGAMENLGAVTFRETALLVDEKKASHAELERIADVVAHELAHMWFGDLVTMKWWNGLWLNEAFATFMEMLAVDAWKPHWKRWETFGVSRAAAFAVDGLRSTRPIEFPVRHPDEASAMFDVLTYEKGASVLRMLEQYLGTEEFRKGIAAYLKKHEYANAETTDLWDAIEATSKQPVRQMMDSWIFQGGFPLVSVEPDEANNGIYLSQQRFLYLPEENKEEPIFQVPVMIRAKTAKGEIRKKLILTEKRTRVELSGKLEWVVVNDGGHGFYRVRYQPELLKSLTSKLWTILAPIERFNLVSDTWASCLAGHTSVNDYLQFASMFKEEQDKNVWAVLLGSMHYLNRVIEPGSRTKYENFIRDLVGPTVKRLTWNATATEDELTRQLRGMVLGALGTLGNDPSVQGDARSMYDKYKKDNSVCDSNIVPALISILAHAGDSKLYEEFYQEFKNAKTPQEEQRYLFALAGFRDESLLKQTLEKGINGDVRSQNAPYLVQSVMMNVAGRALAWEFFKKNWDTMVRLYPENAIPRMCEGVTSLVSTQWEPEVKKFFADHPVKQGGKAIDQHMEKLKVAVLFKQREAQLDDALSLKK